ncbi:LOB domain-containing protein 15 [Tripterygium wilfordii]|uniref:LOB domain-containing protein 15 n=1 Tax=Tripterygium wilfordii TaxID=458696 RepID=A0A7J7DY46_TRIWF|nr:LOB domain-containing protein 15-like [Tripterygium wilfordii]KAF5751310.1 LOB domain-containing protein 15 [Tripterygium wilfordii]
MSRDRDRFDEIGKKIKRDLDPTKNTAASESDQTMGRRHILGPGPGPATLNTITPCAACKLLRRRCAEECPFSPYFSPHEPHKFAAVHKVFGASNVSKLLLDVPENQRSDAANSLVYEANLRLRDPVYGCMGAISSLQHQIQSLQAELNAVREQLLEYKYKEAAANIIHIASASAHDDDHHLAPTLVSCGVASIVIPSPPPPPPQQPRATSFVISSSSSSSSSSTTTSLYSSAVADYSSIPRDNENVPYFE